VLLGCDENDSLVLLSEGVDRALLDTEELEITGGQVFATVQRRLYRGSPRHERTPAMGVKGTICPKGVHPQALLDSSYGCEEEAARWAVTDEGCAFCARSDNAGGWHGYPVRPSHVPIKIIRQLLHDGKLNARTLSADKLCTG